MQHHQRLRLRAAHWWRYTGRPLATYTLLLLAAVFGMYSVTPISQVPAWLWVFAVLFFLVSAIAATVAIFVIAVIFGIPQRFFLPSNAEDEYQGPDGGP